VTRAGRNPVDEFLRVEGSRRIFAAGDIAAAKSGGKSVPGLAPAAKQMGRYIGSYISEDVLGEGPRIKPLVYRHEGDLATIGRKTAVV
jgi:NADH:ubiquinone reductase (H+-translocating)